MKSTDYRKRWALLSLITAAVTLTGCSAATNLKGQTEAAARNGNDATATTGTTAAESSSGGSLALTEPAATDPAIAKVRVSVMQKDCRPGKPGRDDGPMEKNGKRRDGHDGKMMKRQPPQGPAPRGDRMPPPPDVRPDEQTQATNLTDDGAPEKTGAAPDKRPCPKQPGKERCYVKDIEADFAAGSTLTIDEIPEGTYGILVVLEDTAGNPIEHGVAEVEIKAGETATAEVTMEPVGAKATGSVAISIKIPVAAQLSLVTAASEAAASCVPVRVALLDSSSHPALASATVSVALASTSATGAFFSDSSCGTAVTSVDIADLHWYATVYHKDTAAGTPTLSATDEAGTLTAASKALTVK